MLYTQGELLFGMQKFRLSTNHAFRQDFPIRKYCNAVKREKKR